MENSVSDEKKTIREKIKILKNNITFNKIEESNLLIKKIENSDYFKYSEILMAYWSLPDEVFTHDFILNWYQKKTILLPVIVNNDLQLKRFTGIKNMKRSDKLNIEEPGGDFFHHFEKIELIIVPGVAFDKNNHRLGRGKGYYDRFLLKTKALKIGVCFGFQYLEKIPFEDRFDIKMDMIVY